MNTGEILARADFVKTATSEGLKRKAFVERKARQLQADEIFSSKFKDTPGSTNFESRRENIRSTMQNAKKEVNLVGPTPIYNWKNKIPTSTYAKIEPRRQEIAQNLLPPNIFPATSHGRLGNTLSDHVETVKKTKLLKNTGKGLAIGAGLASAAYGGKKIYDHLNHPKDLIKYDDRQVKNLGAKNLYEKVAFSPNMVNGLENLGLGVLAVPSIAGLAGKPMEDKTKEMVEVGGLGILAAHPTAELGHSAMQAIKGAPVGGIGLMQRAGQGIGNFVNKFRSATPALAKLAYSSFYQELLNT